MLMPRRLLLGFAGLLLITGAAPAKPLVHAIPADIASLDPADIRGQQDQEIGVNVYERLVRMKFNQRPDGTLMADPVEVVPELAESWTVDGPVITFKLRPGVKFYPTGNGVDAALEAIKAYCPRVENLIGKEGEAWAGISAKPFVYPQGTGLSWHGDSGSYSGAFIYYAHPEWNVLWGGEVVPGFSATPEHQTSDTRAIAEYNERVGDGRQLTATAVRYWARH